MNSEISPYPEYKDSGLPWLDGIPSHWEEKRAKYYFREVDERSQSGEEPLMSVSHLTGVTPRKESVTMFMSESNVGHKVCRPGDLVINTMWAWMAALGVAPQLGLVSPSYGVYRPLDPSRYQQKFYDHLLRTRPYHAEYICRSTGIHSSRLRLYPDDFLDIPIVCPPREEQEAIANYLDDNAVKVSRFIRNRRKLIALLNEQKQAIIHRAVTRGLDPNVRLKPSGVEWLGEIPEHWEVRRLKYLVKNVNEQTAAGESHESYIALEHVQSWTGRIRLGDAEVSFDSQVKRFGPQDVLFGKLRPYLAKVARPQTVGVCVGEFLVLRTIEGGLLPEFIEQRLRSKQFIDIINSSTFGAKMPRADWAFIGSLPFAFPPTPGEQHIILDVINDQTRSLQMAIDKAQKEVDLIREYRTRLIADVVTGKLDVREAAAGLPEKGLEIEGEEELLEGNEAGMLDEDEAELVEEAEG